MVSSIGRFIPIFRLTRPFARGFRPDLHRMHPLGHQVAQGRVDSALAIDPAHRFKLLGNNLDSEVGFAAAIVPRMPAMLRTIVDHAQLGWI